MDGPNQSEKPPTNLALQAENNHEWLDEVKSLYIAAGMSARDIALSTQLSVDVVKSIIREYKLLDLRKAYLRRGISKLQNKQVGQAKRILDLEYDFKRMRLRQLESILREYQAYYEKHGDFMKRNIVTGAILRNTQGIALQIDLPTVTKEINGLKDSVVLGQGLKQLLYQLDDILNTPKPKERVDDDIIDMTSYDAVFARKD